jgi:predicted DNA-binding protein (MmcQ/YjbR family)
MTIDGLRDYGLAKPGSYLDFPFDDETMTLRVGPAGAGRIFALAGINGRPARANLKCHPELARELRAAYPGAVRPGFHMNKEHWNTVELEAGLDEALLRSLVDLSYDLARAGLPRSAKRSLGLAD